MSDPKGGRGRAGVPVVQFSGAALVLLAFFFALLSSAPAAEGLGEPSWPLSYSLAGAGSATAAFLAQISISETQAGMGALAFAAALIGYHFVFRKYIREQAGVREQPQQTEISGQPLTVRAEVEFVPIPKFREFEKYVHDREHAMRNDMQAITTLIEERRVEGAEQNKELREKLDAKFAEAIKANNVSATKLYTQIQTTTDGLRAEIEDKARETRKQISDMPGTLVQLLRDTGAIGGGRKS